MSDDLIPSLRPPTLALTMGDPAGIGPEIVRAALSDERVSRRARLVVCGPEALRIERAPALHEYRAVGEAEPYEVGVAQASAGRLALAALAEGARLARVGDVDGLVTAPVSKEALWLAGEKVEGQTTLLSRWEGVDAEMLAVAGPLRVLVATRHMPLVEAIARLNSDLVVEKLRILDEGLRGLGVRRPKLALPGLNPHAGEGGLLGSEEGDYLEGAVERARALGIDVHGPFSPDTIFLRAYRGEFDGVLGLYHDQAFIPTKLIEPERGLTVLFGLPYLRVSPAHGTAFDIAGRGVANPENLVTAICQAAEWAVARKRSTPQGVE